MCLKIGNRIIISWDDVNDLTHKLAVKIAQDLPHVENIHGIARGGLIPAVLLSHKLGLPYSNTISSTTLVVDDICDSGKTLKEGVGVYTAVLYHKPHTSKYAPSCFAELHEGNEWIVFPWEKHDAEEIQDYLKK